MATLSVKSSLEENNNSENCHIGHRRGSITQSLVFDMSHGLYWTFSIFRFLNWPFGHYGYFGIKIGRNNDKIVRNNFFHIYSG